MPHYEGGAMATTILKSVIRLRKDTELNYSAVGDTLIPASGEMCIVQMPNNDIRIKVGNGSTKYNELSFIDEPILVQLNRIVSRGYYIDGEFYVDKQKHQKYVPYDNNIYIDNSTYLIYCWDSDKHVYAELQAPAASDTKAGIMKLYDQMGTAVDGTMTQRCTTTEINKKFEVAAGEDETLIFT